MLRHAMRLVLLLALGVIINVAVAWACVLFHGRATEDWAPHHNPRGESPLVVFVTHRFGREIVTGCGRPGTLLDRHGHLVQSYGGAAWWPPEALTSPIQSSAVAAGWPMLALSAWHTTEAFEVRPGPDLQYLPVFRWGIALDPDGLGRQTTWRGDGYMIFPLRPMYRGMVVNSILYAAVLWALVAGPSDLRRRRRRRRGLCPACAYPMGTGAICPECGMPLPTARHAEPPVT